MKIGVLITNYQAWPMTARAVAEVLRKSGISVSKILVMDDASDGPANFPQSTKVLIHRNEKNLGYVRSVNVGMKQMTEDVILLLDCDAWPQMDLVPGIIEHFEKDSHLGALGFLEANAQDRTRIAGDYEPTLVQFLLGQKIGDWFAQRGWFLGKRFVLHSCCMAIRREAFEKIGGLDEDFDFLDADTDFSMRLQGAGWVVSTDDRLKCFHQGSGSPQTVAKRVLRFHRNRWLLLRKHRRVKFISACRIILWLRHAAEFGVLCAARLIKRGPNEKLRDKLTGRRDLLCSVKRNYV